jgi:hypothetical protein
MAALSVRQETFMSSEATGRVTRTYEHAAASELHSRQREDLGKRGGEGRKLVQETAADRGKGW